jgi:hypothetical protein
MNYPGTIDRGFTVFTKLYLIVMHYKGTHQCKNLHRIYKYRQRRELNIKVGLREIEC